MGRSPVGPWGLHRAPLSPKQAISVLEELKPLTGSGTYVFPSLRTGCRPMSDNTILAALRRMGYAKEEMTGHGFRGMASTVLHEKGWPTDCIERQLAHAEGNRVKAMLWNTQRQRIIMPSICQREKNDAVVG